VTHKQLPFLARRDDGGWYKVFGTESQHLKKRKRAVGRRWRRRRSTRNRSAVSRAAVCPARSWGRRGSSAVCSPVCSAGSGRRWGRWKLRLHLGGGVL